MKLLAIETSCDETSAAVVEDGRRILSSVVSSQAAVHAEYGGVVPEIASRKHLELISPVVSKALDDAACTLQNIDGIAVTRGPGLAGALLVGISFAKALSAAADIPFVGIHHIEGHIFAHFLESPLEFPFLALIVSGGHTHIYSVEGFGAYQTLGRTVDDAAGEAFDKSAKLMGLPYPGGAVIDELAREGDAAAFRFPRPLLHDDTLNFSFSGLKTSVLNHVRKTGFPLDKRMLRDTAASFQEAVCDVLAVKTAAAVRKTGHCRLVVAGGVACNSNLRERMTSLAAELGIDLRIPAPALCGDNAAMLAPPADFLLSRGFASPLSMDAAVSWDMNMVKDHIRQ